MGAVDIQQQKLHKGSGAKKNTNFIFDSMKASNKACLNESHKPQERRRGSFCGENLHRLSASLYVYEGEVLVRA